MNHLSIQNPIYGIRRGPAALGTALAIILFLGCKPGREGKPADAPQPAAIKTITTPAGVVMARLPAGEFIMGDDDGADDEKPAHKVRLSAFYMDTREVTQQDYERLLKRNPAKFKGPDRPVERVDWVQAVLYCNLRSLMEGLKPCYDANTLACNFAAEGYRLPNEAEWEYACRAGTNTQYSFGNAPTRLSACGWFKANSGRTTHPVGQRSPNPWGLYDMHGNVAEWCQDIYSETSYQAREGQDPHGPATGNKRVLRGGDWNSSEDNCRAAARNSENARLADACFGSDTYGFRCVRKAAAR